MHPVLVSIESIPAEGKTLTVEYAEGELGGFFAASGLSDVGATAKVTAEIRLLPSGRDVFVLGGLQGRVSYECVRCLERFDREIVGEFHVVCVREGAPGTGEIELHRQDLDVEVLESSSLSVTRIVEEQIILALDPHPVCSESCQGLCPQCGGNRDRSECRCESPSGDPRFAVLAALQTKTKTTG